MAESHTDGLQFPAMALLHAPLKQLVVPVAVIFALAGMAGCFAYFVVAPAPVSQSTALAAPAAIEAWSPTVGQTRATDAVNAADRPRPSDEDIVKAFRLATEGPGVAQDAVFVTDRRTIARPVPLPKRRPSARP
jgi:hypothetical protein